MKRLLVLTLLLACTGCYAPRQTAQVSPCKDPQYLTLTVKNINDMTEREFQYFTAKRRECEEFQARQSAVEAVGNMSTAYTVIAVLGIVATLIIYAVSIP